MTELVRGVRLLPAGTALEQVKLRNTELSLLSSWDGTEVVRQELAAGKRLYLQPQDGWDALELVYVLDGEAVWEGGARTVRLGPGDCLSATPVQEPFTLQAVTNLRVLYVSSRPSFHTVSREVAHLQELAVAVETKDGYTAEHCRRIRDLSVEVGQALCLGPDQQFRLIHGSFLHDLGKVAVPDAILQKPDKLTAEEWVTMKLHPTVGANMLAGTPLAGAARVVAQHHERLDGSGYPLGLKGDEICVEAQIVAVVDTFDAMTSDRVYRPGLPRQTALDELRRLAGIQFRPDVVNTFLQVIDR